MSIVAVLLALTQDLTTGSVEMLKRAEKILNICHQPSNGMSALHGSGRKEQYGKANYKTLQELPMVWELL